MKVRQVCDQGPKRCDSGNDQQGCTNQQRMPTGRAFEACVDEQRNHTEAGKCFRELADTSERVFPAFAKIDAEDGTGHPDPAHGSVGAPVEKGWHSKEGTGRGGDAPDPCRTGAGSFGVSGAGCRPHDGEQQDERINNADEVSKPGTKPVFVKLFGAIGRVEGPSFRGVGFK